MNSLQGIRILSNRVQCNRGRFFIWKQSPFHTKSYLFDQAKFVDKPLWFKKFKIEQAKMQKDDGLPVFLKKGFPDKVLFNFTLGLVIVNMFLSVKSLYNLDNLDKK